VQRHSEPSAPRCLIAVDKCGQCGGDAREESLTGASLAYIPIALVIRSDLCNVIRSGIALKTLISISRQAKTSLPISVSLQATLHVLISAPDFATGEAQANTCETFVGAAYRGSETICISSERLTSSSPSQTGKLDMAKFLAAGCSINCAVSDSQNRARHDTG
jgi:hypothetical protein